MELRPPSDPLDAFFAPVRRGHPDVDIVVLPPPGPAPSRDPVDGAQLSATLDRVAHAAERVWAAALGSTYAPTATWTFGPDEGTVVASVRGSAESHDGFAALAALRGALETDGWEVRRFQGAVERLTGSRGDTRVAASYADSTGALLLEVSSSAMFVGHGRARALVRR